MKAILNGALHLSELDGWWDEAYQPELGWALGIRLREDLADDARDAAEAHQLVEILEQDLVPMFFSRRREVCRASGWRVSRRSHPDVGATIRTPNAWSTDYAHARLLPAS